MLKIVLYLLFCLCLFLMVYIGFFKKDRIEIRLEEIGKDPLDTQDMDVTVQKQQDKNNTLRFIRIPQSVRDDIAASGIKLRTEEFVMLWIALVLFPTILLYIFGAGALLSICVAFIMGVLPPFYIKMKRKKRLELFGVQLGDALPLMSNGLRAGFSFEQAFASVAKDMPDPISQEITKSCRELSMGVPLEKVLNSLTKRTKNKDLELLTSAVLIQRKVGGNLADILETISVTIQERIRLKNHIKTITAQGKYSGYLIGAIPVFLYLAFSVISPGYMSVMYTSTYGYVLSALVVILEIVAFIIIKKMITLE